MKRTRKAQTVQKTRAVQAVRKTLLRQKQKARSNRRGTGRVATMTGSRLRTSLRQVVPRCWESWRARRSGSWRLIVPKISCLTCSAIRVAQSRSRRSTTRTGSNSKSSTYTPQDRQDAVRMRDTLIEKDPDEMRTADLGQTPSNGLFHAETNVLIRAARQSGGTLAGRSLEIYVDRDMCLNCRSVVPLVGLELGNPNLTFVDPKMITTIYNGSVISRSKR